jgi:hypothetical protein
LLALERLRYEFHKSAPVYRRFKACSTAKDAYVRANALYALVTTWKEHPETLPWLESREEMRSPKLSDDAPLEVLRDVSSETQSLGWLLRIARIATFPRLCSTVSEELVRIRRAWEQSPEQPDPLAHIRAESRAWLEEQATYCKDDWVGDWAFQCLVLLFEHSVSWQDILRACSRGIVPSVRRQAFQQQLSAQRDADVVPWLKTLVENEGWDIADDAMKELLRTRGADPSLWPWVVAQVERHPLVTVRRAGLELLLRTASWRYLARAVEVVERCQSDPDVGIRAVAARVLKESPTNGDFLVTLPAYVDDVSEGVWNWCVRAGERVEQGQVLVELEVDKASITFEAPCAGRVVSLAGPARVKGLANRVVCVIAPDPPLWR